MERDGEGDEERDRVEEGEERGLQEKENSNDDGGGYEDGDGSACNIFLNVLH